MRNVKNTRRAIAVLGLLKISLFTACSKDDNQTPFDNCENNSIAQKDKDALLFILEEEKLARYTYDYLDNLYAINQFANIKRSEESHMDAVVNLLEQFDMRYTILPNGEFANNDIQDIYGQFVAKDAIDNINALEVGATIEDLDIVDLENYINATSNGAIISVFESLQCGSRNHLRSFASALENAGSTYTPQFLTEVYYSQIINDSSERCGQ